MGVARAVTLGLLRRRTGWLETAFRASRHGRPTKGRLDRFAWPRVTGVAREPRLRSTSAPLGLGLSGLSGRASCPSLQQCHAGAWHGWCKPGEAHDAVARQARSRAIRGKHKRRRIVVEGTPMANALGTRHSDDVMRIVHSLPRPGRELPDRTIARSWMRCANDYRLDPARPDAPNIIDTRALADRREQYARPGARSRTAEIDRLYDQIAGSGYALLLTDASGIILYEKVDPTLKDVFRGAGLVPGADWSEKSRGTNGMGTCLAERKPVTVHRNDHFYTHHIGLTCFGVPIRGPVDDLIAVLDASCIGAHDTRATQMHTMALVRLSAHIIEKCLFLRHHEHNAVLRFHSRPGARGSVPRWRAGARGRRHRDRRGLHRRAAARSERSLRARRPPDRRDLRCRRRGQRLARSAAQCFARRRCATRAGGRATTRACTSGARPRTRRRGRVSRTVPEVVQVPPNPKPPVLTLEDLAGEDPQMLRNVRSAHRIADSGVSVLIQGATGSGKEAFAHAMHLRQPPRGASAFVAVNCAAIPETLIESELFGYKAGAFTGARKEGMKGKILQSSGGTLFLDEIGDMPLALQTRLLRVLEEQEIVPLGSETPHQGGAARHRGLAPEPARDDRARRIPRRPLLPPERHHARAAAAGGSRGSRARSSIARWPPRPATAGPPPSRWMPCSGSCPIPGRATSASCATSSARRSPSAKAASCAGSICRARFASLLRVRHPRRLHRWRAPASCRRVRGARDLRQSAARGGARGAAACDREVPRQYDACGGASRREPQHALSENEAAQHPARLRRRALRTGAGNGPCSSFAVPHGIPV